MPKTTEVTKGTIFNRLIVIKELPKHTTPSGQTKRMFLCECMCENRTRIKAVLGNLRNGNTNSCGCYKIEQIKAVDKTTHNLSKHMLYPTYLGMINRCYNEDNWAYKWYGARGIKVCKEWLIKKNDQGLKNFIAWNDSLPEEKRKQKGLEIDRKDNNKSYSPSNCRWVTAKVNCNNRKYNIKVVHENKTYELGMFYEEFGDKSLKYTTVITRIHKGWLPIEAVTLPLLVKRKNKATEGY